MCLFSNNNVDNLFSHNRYKINLRKSKFLCSNIFMCAYLEVSFFSLFISGYLPEQYTFIFLPEVYKDLENPKIKKKDSSFVESVTVLYYSIKAVFVLINMTRVLAYLLIMVVLICIINLPQHCTYSYCVYNKMADGNELYGYQAAGKRGIPQDIK